MTKPLLEMSNIHKKFPGVYALKGVNLDLYKGELLALVGENGAGKSTLINVLGGIHKKDAGEIRIDGRLAEINSVKDAREQGISIIHQELVLVPYLTVAENIFINREPLRNGMVDFDKMFSKAQLFINDLNLDLDAHALVADLTIAQQQMVEIVRAISFNAKIIVMDEPTSSLSEKEIRALFDSIKLLKKKQIGIIYISHRLSELHEIADRVTILRDGESVGTFNHADVTDEEIVRHMVGREIINYYARDFHEQGDTVLRVDNLSSHQVHDISFELHRGEILGFAGLVGAGRTEVVKAILGFDERKSGVIEINGERCKFDKPQDAYEKGIGYIPESRREESLFPQQPVTYNLTLRVLEAFISHLKVDHQKEREITEYYRRQLSIRTPSIDAIIQNLSGGNQQKVVISRWLAANPNILIMDEPTRGIDVGAKAEIYEIMNNLVKEGISIIMISSELPEVINMSDRVVVMRDGSISKILQHHEITQENIMKYAVSM